MRAVTACRQRSVDGGRSVGSRTPARRRAKRLTKKSPLQLAPSGLEGVVLGGGFTYRENVGDGIGLPAWLKRAEGM